jgi:hypothetical protein
MTTYTQVLARANVTVPDQTIADIDVPILTTSQRQGDVAVFTRPTVGKAELATMTEVSTEGVAVVRGEQSTGGNAHILHADGPVFWSPSNPVDGDVHLGVIHVPVGSIAWLIHTDEHGVNGIGPGTYRVHGKREQRDEIARVAD